MGQMTSQAIATQEQRWKDIDGNEIAVTGDALREIFNCKTATDLELRMFIELCKAQHLNPFTREAYLIKYGTKNPASLVIGKDAFTRRAEANPQFDGIEAGVIVLRGSEVHHMDGGFHLPGDQIVGGWAKVYRKNLSRPISKSVTLQEYQGKRYDKEKGEMVVTKMWAEKTATMIEKVPIVQGLREAFPSMFSGMYDESEVGEQGIPIVNVGGRDVNTDTGEIVGSTERKGIPARTGTRESAQYEPCPSCDKDKQVGYDQCFECNRDKVPLLDATDQATPPAQQEQAPPPSEDKTEPEKSDTPPAGDGEYVPDDEHRVKYANLYLEGIAEKREKGETITKQAYDNAVKAMALDNYMVQSTLFEGKNPRAKAGSWEKALVELCEFVIREYSS